MKALAVCLISGCGSPRPGCQTGVGDRTLPEDVSSVAGNGAAGDVDGRMADAAVPRRSMSPQGQDTSPDTMRATSGRRSKVANEVFSPGFRCQVKEAADAAGQGRC